MLDTIMDCHREGHRPLPANRRVVSYQRPRSSVAVMLALMASAATVFIDRLAVQASSIDKDWSIKTPLKTVSASLLPKHTASRSFENWSSRLLHHDTSSSLVLTLRGGGDAGGAAAAAVKKVSFASLSLAEQVIHVVTRVSMIHGMVNYIAPGPVCESYGILKPSLLTQLLTRRIGIVLLSMGILVYGVFVKEWDVEVCFGMSQIPWIVEFCGTILNDEARRVGFNSSLAQYVALLVHAFAMYGAHHPYSPIIMLTTGCFDTITGAVMYFYPEFSLQSRGAVMKRTDVSRWSSSYAATKDYGLWLCIYGTMLMLYAWGTMDPLKVFIYTRTFIFLRSFIVNVMEVDKLGFSPTKSNVWFCYHFVVAAGLWLSIWND
jgi:hypothetical protein